MMDIPELPNSPDAEDATLGSLLMNRDAIAAVAAWLKPDRFYQGRHMLIYESIVALAARRIPPDVQTVADDLKRRDRLDAIGGLEYLLSLGYHIPTSYHVEHYARIVERAWADRQMISAGAKIAALGYDQEADAETKHGTALALLDTARLASRGNGFFSAAQLAEEEYERKAAAQRGDLPSGGARTGLRDLDEILLGLNDKDFIIVAARP